MPLLFLFFRPYEMKTRIIQTRYWDDLFVQESSKHTKFLYIYLLTSQYINLSGVFQLSDKKIMFETGMTENELNTAKQELQVAKKVLFHDGWIKVVNALKNNRYTNSEKNIKPYEDELAKLPDSVLSYFNSILDTTIDTSMDSTMDSTLKYKIQNIKYKTKNIKKEKKERKLVDRVIDTFNEITGKHFKPSDTLERSLNARLQEGYTTKDIVTAIKKAYEDPYLCGENDSGKWYLTPEYILRKNKLDQWINS